MDLAEPGHGFVGHSAPSKSPPGACFAKNTPSWEKYRTKNLRLGLAGGGSEGPNNIINPRLGHLKHLKTNARAPQTLKNKHQETSNT